MEHPGYQSRNAREVQTTEDAIDVQLIDVRLRLEINRYLYYELGLDEEENRVSASWPFQLHEIRDTKGVTDAWQPQVRLFRFSHAASVFLVEVEAGRPTSFWLGEGLTIDDLRLYRLAVAWITNHKVIDLDQAKPATPGIPVVADRRRAITETATASLHSSGKVKSTNLEIQILEGLFLPSQNRYLALVAEGREGQAKTNQWFVVGSGVDPHVIEHPESAPWPRLMSVVGEMLERGELRSW